MLYCSRKCGRGTSRGLSHTLGTLWVSRDLLSLLLTIHSRKNQVHTFPYPPKPIRPLGPWKPPPRGTCPAIPRLGSPESLHIHTMLNWSGKVMFRKAPWAW